MNDNSLYDDYYKAIKRDESSVVLNSFQAQPKQAMPPTQPSQPTQAVPALCHIQRHTDSDNSPADDNCPQVTQPIPTTSKGFTNHVTFSRPRTLETTQPSVTVTTPNGQHQHQHYFTRHQAPIQKSSIEVVLGSPTASNGGLTTGTYSTHYYSRVLQNQSDAEEKYYYNQVDRQYEFCNTPAELAKSLRWIHWRMTLFIFYWIVWFIGLILVIIIVAYRAKVWPSPTSPNCLTSVIVTDSLFWPKICSNICSRIIAIDWSTVSDSSEPIRQIIKFDWNKFYPYFSN